MADYERANGSILPNPGPVKVPCAEIGQPDKWLVMFGSIFVCPLVLMLIVLALHGIKWIRKSFGRQAIRLPTGRAAEVESTDSGKRESRRHSQFHGRSHSTAQPFHVKLQDLISAKIVSSPASAIVLFLANLISFFIYLTEVSERRVSLESCYIRTFLDDPGAVLDLILNGIFGVHFVIRFLVTDKKWAFLTSCYSVIDYCTVPPAIVGAVLNRNWTGLRFLRIFYVVAVPDILQLLRFLKTRTALRLTQLVCTVVSALLVSAGVFHLLENTGDIFHGTVRNQQNHNYWEFVYFCVVTASTVGYGDIFCITVFGRMFAAVFILSTLAVVASVIPDIFSIISNRKKYAGSYEETKSGRRHIMVCGHITFATAQGFLKEFLHKDRGVTDIKVVFMDLNEPDMEMETLLKRYFSEVEYFQGTAMKSHDLLRVKADTSDAVFIVANKQCSDPDAEDAANILRVISIKNFHSSIRVIVEMMQYHNKAYLLNIPSWNWRNGDEVVCLAELKLGLIAQSCVAPGFSTLMANLFTSRSFRSLEEDSWRSEYLRGTGLEMYSENLSDSFMGMTFAETAAICLLRLDIMLVAVSLWNDYEDESTFVINPKPEVVITAAAQGFFLADSAEDVQRAAFYCTSCHSNISTERIASIRKCDCKKASVADLPSPSIYAGQAALNSGLLLPLLKLTASPLPKDAADVFKFAYVDGDIDSERPSKRSQSGEAIDPKFDSTGMFHWCAPRTFESAVLDRQTAASKAFRNHVVVGVFADADSPLIGLNSLVMPLRSSNFKYEDLREIVILGNAIYLEREWRNLYNFPKVTLVKGSALSRADLRAVKLQSCLMCVTLTSKVPNYNDAFLMDKEAIMASLNIKAMDFQRRPRRHSGVLSASNSGHIRGSRVPASSPIFTPRKVATDSKVQMITDLSNDSSVQFLDPDDEDDNDDNIGFFATEPFACGTTFTASVLDSLMSMVYFNPCAFRVVRALIFGGASSELEEILAEGAGLIGGDESHDADKYHRAFISQSRMADPPFNAYAKSTFGELFVNMLSNHGLLCLGLFRLIHDVGITDAPYASKRYVATKPVAGEILRETDYVFVLKRSDSGQT